MNKHVYVLQTTEKRTILSFKKKQMPMMIGQQSLPIVLSNDPCNNLSFSSTALSWISLFKINTMFEKLFFIAVVRGSKSRNFPSTCCDSPVPPPLRYTHVTSLVFLQRWNNVNSISTTYWRWHCFVCAHHTIGVGKIPTCWGKWVLRLLINVWVQGMAALHALSLCMVAWLSLQWAYAGAEPVCLQSDSERRKVWTESEWDNGMVKEKNGSWRRRWLVLSLWRSLFKVTGRSMITLLRRIDIL